MKNTLLLFAFLFSTYNSTAQWTQIGTDIDGENAYDSSGSSVSLSADGSVIAISAINNDGNSYKSGHVRIYENISGFWTQKGADIDGEEIEDYSGSSVSLSADGSIVAISATSNDGNGTNSGHVRIYEYSEDNWIQIGNDIDGEDAFDGSGKSIDLSDDGSIIAIGAPYNDGNGSSSGHVRIYKNISGTWTQIGADIDGEAEDNDSGFSVSLSADGSIVAIGAPWNDGNGENSGHVRVYKNISNNWTQIGADINGETEGDKSGSSISLSSDGSIVAIGSNENYENGLYSGHVRIFENIAETWTQIGADIDGEAEYDYSGGSICLSADGSIVAIGAIGSDGNGSFSGHVKVYKNTGSIWAQIGSNIEGEAASDNSGSSISLSANGAILAIGAPGNDGNGIKSGHTRIFTNPSLGYDTIELNDSLISIYPNPVIEGYTILDNKSTETLKEVLIYDINGKFILKFNLDSLNKENMLNVSSLSSGEYFLIIKSDQSFLTKKLIINLN